MMFAAFFLGLLATAIALPSDNGRIVGGRFAEKGEVPYIVSIRQFENGQWAVICSGSILSEKFILSAAHCFKYPDQPENYAIQYGQIDKFSTENVILAKKIANHEDYSPQGLRPADIAIIKLQEDIYLGPGVETVELPTGPPNIVGNSVRSVLAGWGRDENYQKVRYLKIAEFPAFNDQLCRQYLGGAFSPDLHLCAGSLDGTQKQCSGDSGGPLVFNDGRQHGIVAWSVKPCTSKDLPGIFTRVHMYLGWINNKLKTM